MGGCLCFQFDEINRVNHGVTRGKTHSVVSQDVTAEHQHRRLDGGVPSCGFVIVLATHDCATDDDQIGLVEQVGWWIAISGQVAGHMSSGCPEKFGIDMI